MKNKKIKTDDISYSEILIAKNVMKNNNSNDIIDKYTNMISSYSFFGVHLSLYVNEFHQSKRMELYRMGLKQLFALGLGILFYSILYYIILFYFFSLILFYLYLFYTSFFPILYISVLFDYFTIPLVLV